MTAAVTEVDATLVPAVRLFSIERLAPFAAAAVALAVAALIATPYAVGIFHDDGVYVILGKAIASGDGYRYLHLPGAPPAAHYPPGYPLLLAALWRLAPSFPANTGLFLFVNALFLASIAWSTVAVARRVLGWSPLEASVAGVVATISLPLMMLSRLVLSEPMFVALLLPTLIAAEAVVANRGVGAHRWQAFGVGMAAGALMLVRTHGAALEMALVCTLALQHRWRDVWQAIAGAAVVLAPWELWQLTHPAVLPEILRGSYGSYASWLADGFRGGARFVVRVVVTNLREIRAILGDRFSLSDRAAPRTATALLAAALMMTGAVQAVRRAPVTVAFVAIYVAVLLVWPFTPWRFVFALWPLVVLALGEAARWAFAAARRRRPSTVLAAAGFVLLAGGAVRSEVRSYAGGMLRGTANAATAQMAPVVQWVAANSAPNDVVGVDAEPLVYLFTGRRAVPLLPFTAADYLSLPSKAQNAVSMRRLLEDVPVTVVATVAPGLYASATRLVRADSSRPASNPRLVRIATIAAGGAFRVERP